VAIAEKDRPRVKLECLRMLVQLKLDAAKTQLISGFVDTYLRLSRLEQERFAAQAEAVLQPAEKEDVMEIVTSWMKEGIKKGRAEGRAEGRAQGRAQGRTEATRELVLDLLTRRVGTLPAPLHEAVTRLPLARLRALATDLLDFQQSSDLERWLAGH
jgi:flagellar biosynthesis/type III secretory pathway protein FliH